jgi:anti-anti-sigma factor
MSISVQVSDSAAVIRLEGRFDFQAHRDFKQCCDSALANESVRRIEVDFDNVEYLDSSALGMLLMLKERAERKTRTISLVNCKGTVRNILEVANFNKLFTVQ